jgi:hypothetical protein
LCLRDSFRPGEPGEPFVASPAMESGEASLVAWRGAWRQGEEKIGLTGI